MADRNTYQTIMRQALTDPAFRERLKSDARAALAEHGVNLPPGRNVQVHEADANTAHIVLPPRGAGDAGQLSDQELMISAGAMGTITGCTCPPCPTGVTCHC